MQYNNNNNNFQFENALQTGLMSKFTSGNPFIDPFIHMTIYSLIGVIVFNLQKIMNLTNINYYFWCVVNPIYEYICKLLNRDPKVLDKYVKIDYITDNRKVNNLYRAVDWYLSTKCTDDMIKETPLKMIYEDDIETSQIGSKLGKKIENRIYKKIQFKDHEISYLLDKNLLTVYADKERTRENFNITLHTKISNDATTDILEEFCQFCLDSFIKSKKSDVWVQKIFINNVQGEWKSQESNNKRKIDTVILKNGNIEDIKDDVKSFLDSREWYHDRDIPYTRGYLLYGPPGTGKTSLIKAISTFTKRHMHYLMLNNVQNDNQLLDLLSNIKFSETILIIEDIDCMTKIIEDRNKKETENDKTDDKLTEKELKQQIKRKLKEKMEMPKNTNKLTLSGLLNAIDGIFNNDGRIMIMTTNHPEVLDDALIRPGRIDRKILLDYCDTYQINGIFEMMYDNENMMKNIDIINKLKTITEFKYSPAEITSLFLRYRNKPLDALNNIHELDNEKFAVTERKFFGKEIEKLTKIENQQNIPNGTYSIRDKYYNDTYSNSTIMPMQGQMMTILN